MDESQRKAMLKETFNTVSEGFDGKALRFFADSAKHLAASLDLRGDERVLDVATGTGHAALSIAVRLPRGWVTGVDFSLGMLDQAKRKAASLNIGNVEFLERDMQTLGFPADSFDVATCAFGIFFVDDMDAQLSHITETVKPEGRVAITEFQETLFYPLADMMFDRLAGYGVKKQAQDWKRIATEADCRKLFENAGLRNVRVEFRDVGYYLGSADEWWDVIWNAGFRRLVSRLPARDQEQFRREHLQEVDALKTDDGIWLDVGILITIGAKP